MVYRIEGGRPVLVGLPSGHVEVIAAGPASRIQRRGKEKYELTFNLAKVGQGRNWAEPEASVRFPAELLTLLSPGSEWESTRRKGNRDSMPALLAVSGNVSIPIAELVSPEALPSSTLEHHHLPEAIGGIPVYIIRQGEKTYYLPVLEVVRALSSPNDDFLNAIFRGTITSWYDSVQTQYRV